MGKTRINLSDFDEMLNFEQETTTPDVSVSPASVPQNGSMMEMDFDQMESFPNHKFKLYEGQQLSDMVESVKQFGILLPIILWHTENGKYIIISGHNRRNAAQLAGLTKGPVIIRENLTHDEAVLIVTETNLRQRSFADMSHSERAYCLSQHYEALKSQGKRNDLLTEIETLLNPHGCEEIVTSSEVQTKLRSDEKVAQNFLGPGQRSEKHLWAGSIQAQLSKMRELYDAVPEKSEWLTEQDMERYEKQMAAPESGAGSVDTAVEPEPVSAVPTLDEEEISDLVDVVLCADDVTPDTREWMKELCDFFQGGHKQTTKANALKAFYRRLDTDYTTKTGDYLHITGTDTSLDFEMEGQSFSVAYSELTEHVDRLILHGVYPYSAEDSILDDYSIPDEIREMNGAEESEAEEKDAEPLDSEQIIADFLREGSGTSGGKLRIQQAVLSMQSKKDRQQLIKEEYGWYGHSGGGRGLSAVPGKGIALRYESARIILPPSVC